MNKDLFLSEKKLKTLFLEYNINIKKEKGQNFLIDFNILTKLIQIIGKENEAILEIGSGPGNLTIFLRDIAERVIGVEVDRDFFPILMELQKRYPSLSFIFEDIRRIDLKNVLSEHGLRRIKIVGNIPYYISSFIVRKLYEWRSFLEEGVIMVPKDVGDRIVSLPGSKVYGILSVAAQAAFYVKPVFRIKPGSFYPRPKVDSEVLTFIPHNIYNINNEELFFHILNVVFGKRRKMIVNTLRAIISEEDRLMRILTELNIDPKSRPETLSVNDFVKLYEKIRYFS